MIERYGPNTDHAPDTGMGNGSPADRGRRHELSSAESLERLIRDAGGGDLLVPIDPVGFRDFLEEEGVVLKPVPESGEAGPRDPMLGVSMAPRIDVLVDGRISIQVNEVGKRTVDPDQLVELMARYGERDIAARDKEYGRETIPEEIGEMIELSQAWYRKKFEDLGLPEPIFGKTYCLPLKMGEGGLHSGGPLYKNSETGKIESSKWTLIKNLVPEMLDPEYIGDTGDKKPEWLRVHERWRQEHPEQAEIEVEQETVVVPVEGVGDVTLEINPENAWKWYKQYKDLMAVTHEMCHETANARWEVVIAKNEADGKPYFKQFASVRNGIWESRRRGREMPSYEEGYVEYMRKKAMEDIMKKNYPEAYAFQQYLIGLGEQAGLEKGTFRVFHVDNRVEKNGKIILHTDYPKYEGGTRLVEYLRDEFIQAGYTLDQFDELHDAARYNSEETLRLARALVGMFGMTNDPARPAVSGRQVSALELLFKANENPESPMYAGKILDMLKGMRATRLAAQ